MQAVVAFAALSFPLATVALSLAGIRGIPKGLFSVTTGFVFVWPEITMKILSLEEWLPMFSLGYSFFSREIDLGVLSDLAFPPDSQMYHSLPGEKGLFTKSFCNDFSVGFQG